MLKLPGELTPATFLSHHWQKAPLFMPQAIAALRPSLSRNELAWLATNDDVEARLVFTAREKSKVRYRVETGPFDAAYLQHLPNRNWTLLVHDVEKHLPALRKLFALVPFIPDWRIDDLMVSFAAPGGSVGPHRDKYDVFLCQGIGVREWRISSADIVTDTAASDDLALLQEFAGEENYTMCQGDVLYLPPGIAHWGIAQRACMTYSIGMQAPPGYTDRDLQPSEARPGHLSTDAIARSGTSSSLLGCEVTAVKEWLRPPVLAEKEVQSLLQKPATLGGLRLHGMTRIAYDDERLFVNGATRRLDAAEQAAVAKLCARRRLNRELVTALGTPCLAWLLAQGAFELPHTM